MLLYDDDDAISAGQFENERIMFEKLNNIDIFLVNFHITPKGCHYLEFIF